MDSSVREQGSDRQQTPKRSWMSLWLPLSLIKWLAGLFNLTEKEQEEAGIYLDRRFDE